MAAWGRMGGGQRPRPCGYLCVFDCLPAHLPPLHPHGEGSCAETPCHFPAPQRLRLPARSSQTAGGPLLRPPTALRCAVQGQAPSCSLSGLAHPSGGHRADALDQVGRVFAFPAIIAALQFFFVDTGVRKSANVNSSGGRPPKGAVNRARRKRPFGVLAEGAQWEIKRRITSGGSRLH